jgi:hypothetical protein
MVTLHKTLIESYQVYKKYSLTMNFDYNIKYSLYEDEGKVVPVPN